MRFKSLISTGSAITALAFSITALMAENQPWLTAERVTLVEGKFAGALQFMDEGAYLDCRNHKTYDLTGLITIEAWVKRMGSAPWRKIVAKGSDMQLFNQPGGLQNRRHEYRLGSARTERGLGADQGPQPAGHGAESGKMTNREQKEQP